MGCQLRLWRLVDGHTQLVAGEQPDSPTFEIGPEGSPQPTSEGPVLTPLPGFEGHWVEQTPFDTNRPVRQANLVPVVTQILKGEQETWEIAQQLADRYEEINLLYTISEILGSTTELFEGAQKIIEELSIVIGARRSSMYVYDESDNMLRPVAGWGVDVSEFESIPVGDAESIAARAFREACTVYSSPPVNECTDPTQPTGRPYRGCAYLSTPILYRSPGEGPTPIGVVNLTDRSNADTFTLEDRRLLEAIANQIGAAVQNARLISQGVVQQRMLREMELASDLQLKLLPSPQIVGPPERVAARCIQAGTVGGDFYNFLQLPGDQVGVMLGDVSSHGFGAALIMALVLSAAGIHAEAAHSPDAALVQLLGSVADELAKTEMHLSVFYGVTVPECHCLRYANAGHPYAYVIRADGTVHRLTATSPPLGLAEEGRIQSQEVPWGESDMLVLFSDGIPEARDAAGQLLGEGRVVQYVARRREDSAAEIVDGVFDFVTRFSSRPQDDRALVILKA